MMMTTCAHCGHKDVPVPDDRFYELMSEGFSYVNCPECGKWFKIMCEQPLLDAIARSKGYSDWDYYEKWKNVFGMKNWRRKGEVNE